METNCSESEYDWDQKVQGMSFNDDENRTDSTHPFSGITATIQSIRSEISVDMGSLDSLQSDASSSVSDDGERTRGLPQFLISKMSMESSKYESRQELRVASVKAAYSRVSLSASESEDGSWVAVTDPVKIAMHGFLLGQEVSLEGFRSLSAKKALLAKAIEINDGNAIIAVTLFLQQTLRDSLFQLILMENKAAASHYIRYLETRSETAKLVDLLCMLGRTEDALNIRYKIILRGTNLDRLQSQLSHFYAAECSNTDEYIAGLVQSHLNVVEAHKILLPQGKFKQKNEGRFPSVLATLRCLSEHYYDKEPTFPLSPLKFSITQKLTTKQHAWACFFGLVKVLKWPQIESLLIRKGWTGSVQGVLPAEDVCKILKEYDAPVDLLSMFVCLIDDADKKLSTAKHLNCHKVVIDIYASKRDKSKILEYQEKLDPKSKDAVYASTILKPMK